MMTSVPEPLLDPRERHPRGDEFADPGAGLLGGGGFVRAGGLQPDVHVFVVGGPGDRVPVVGGGDLVDARAVGDPAAVAVGVGHAKAVGQGDLTATHRIVDLDAHDDAAGRSDDGDPAAGVEAELGEIRGVDAQRAIGVALAPRGSAQDLVSIVGAALAVHQRVGVVRVGLLGGGVEPADPVEQLRDGKLDAVILDELPDVTVIVPAEGEAARAVDGLVKEGLAEGGTGGVGVECPLHGGLH